MSFAAGAFSGGARGAGGSSGGGSNRPKRGVSSSNQQDPNASNKEGKEGRGIEGDIETPNTQNTPMATASLMFHALTSGIGAMGRDGPDKK